MSRRQSIDRLESRVLLSASSASAHGLRVNAGGVAYVDSVGRGFAPDGGFVGGTTVQATPYDVLITSDDPLFYTYRSGSQFTFSQPIANGHYALFLEFAESQSTAAGQRTFDVSAEGQQVLNDYDIFADAGAAGSAVAKSFDVAVADGHIDLAFTGVVGEAVVSAIVLVPTDVPVEGQPYSWLNLSDPSRTILSASHLREIGQGMLLYSNENKGKYPPNLREMQYYEDVTYDTFGDPRTSTMLPRGSLSLVEQLAWGGGGRNDYIYRGAGLKNTAPAETVLAYENPDRVPGSLNVLMGDGSVQLMDRATAAATIGFTPHDPTDPPPIWPPHVSQDPQIVTSQDHLRQIENALLQYANGHSGRFPAQWGTLYFEGWLHDASLFVNPRTGTTPPPSNWTTQQIADWINASTDYVYLGNGRRYTMPALDPLVYENPAGLNGGINILFGDGFIDFQETRWANRTLATVRPPSVTATSFNYLTGPQSIAVSFSEDVNASLAASDLQLTNLTTNTSIPSASIALDYNFATQTGDFTFPGLLGGALPDGNYRLTLAAASVADASSNPMPADFTFDFFFLNGDANHDRHVDVTDLGILATNWQGNGDFSQADFNLDGHVDVTDLGILATNWQKSLPVLSLSKEPAPSVAIASVAIKRPSRHAVVEDMLA